jgi:AmmeMemoRadiSam system protein A
MADETHRQLGDEARRFLLAWARRSIRAALAGESGPSASTPPPAPVADPGACFVSLHTRQGELRGCIGTFDASQPLWQSVARMAVAAATQDYRFAPLAPADLDDCAIEISALTPRRPVAPEQIIIGEHGLWISQGARHGVLLPQVATSHGWDRETFLAHTCMKAGLPEGAWREPGTRIEAFGAEVFREESEA